MQEFLSQPWPWYVGGPLIGLIMLLMMWFGKIFGVSHTLRTTCTIIGAGRFSEFFRFNWKDRIWNLIFVSGAIIGGFVASQWIPNPDPVNISPATVARIQEWGLATNTTGLAPSEIYSFEGLMSTRGVIMIILGGFLIGFGTRYAGGCTSGHAITGLSNLQLPSLIAVIGFFAGGLITTFFILPLLFTP